jgi:hypothetical protein
LLDLGEAIGGASLFSFTARSVHPDT